MPVETLKKAGCGEEIIKHCISVSRNAAIIADRVKIKVDKELIKEGALLHDIGRCKTHDIKHAVVGAALARELGVPEKVVSIIERHIGAGITVEETAGLGLPAKDYCPKTPEEKIVSYADNLTDSDKMLSFEESLKRFKKMLGEEHPAIKRFILQHEEIQSWTNK